MDGEIKAVLEAIHDEDKRQNKRIEKLETDVENIHSIALSIQELTIEIKHLREDVQAQSIRLEKIENAPLNRINGAKDTARNTTISVIISAVVGALIVLVAKQIGM